MTRMQAAAVWLGSVLATGAFGIAAEPQPAAPGAAKPGGAEVSFAKDVQPILTAKCVSCHNPRKRSSDLDLQTSYKAVMEAVSVGKPERSDLYLSLVGKGRKQMPPKSSLPAADIEKVRAWIAAGAPQN